MDAEIERLRAAGEPLTAAELHADHRLPVGSLDLTAEWSAVLVELDATRPDLADPQLQVLPLIGPRTLDELEPAEDNEVLLASEAYLNRIEPQVQSLLKLSTKPGEVCYPVNFEDHIAANLDHTQQIRHAARVLELRARVFLILGQADQLEPTLLAMLALVHTLDHSRTMIEHLVRCSIARRCSASILEAANRGALTPEQLRKFAAALDRTEFKNSAWLAYTGERVMGWEMMDVNASLIADDPGGLTTLITSAGPVDRAFFLDGFARAVSASQQDYSDARQEFDVIDQDIRALDSLHPWERMHYLYSVMTLLVPCGAHVAFFHQDAHCRITQAALLAHENRLRVGVWPGSVSDLTEASESPGRLRDPFTGDLLRMREDGPNLVIYSIGADQLDDGGFEENERWKPDIVVTAKAPPMLTIPE
jgi:hypothetical protein